MVRQSLLVLALLLVWHTGSAQWVQTSLRCPSVNCFAAGNGFLFAGASDSVVYRSTDYGVSWTVSDTLNGHVIALIVSGSNLIAGTERPDTGISAFVSTDNGTSWVAASGIRRIVAALAADGATVFAGGNGVFRSTDGGMSWTLTTGGIGSHYFMSLAVSGSYVFAGTQGYGV